MIKGISLIHFMTTTSSICLNNIRKYVTYIPQSLPSKTLYIIDGTSVLHHSYYSKEYEKGSRALSKNGVDCTAVAIMLNRICRFINMVGPNYVVLTFDTDKNTTKKDLYPPYKMNRPKVSV